VLQQQLQEARGHLELERKRNEELQQELNELYRDQERLEETGEATPADLPNLEVHDPDANSSNAVTAEQLQILLEKTMAQQERRLAATLETRLQEYHEWYKGQRQNEGERWDEERDETDGQEGQGQDRVSEMPEEDRAGAQGETEQPQGTPSGAAHPTVPGLLAPLLPLKGSREVTSSPYSPNVSASPSAPYPGVSPPGMSPDSSVPGWAVDKELTATNVSLKLRNFPKPGGLSDWFTNVRDQLATVSRDTDAAIAWYRAVHDPNVSDADLLEPGEGFKRLDLKLYNAIMALDSNAGQFLSVKNKVGQVNRELEKNSRRATGRLVLRMIKAEFSVNEHIERSVKMSRLTQTVWTGDDKIEKFYYHWLKCVSEIDPPPEDEYLQAILDPILRQSKVLEWDMHMYDSYAEHCSYAYLLSALERRQRIEKDARNRESMTKGILPGGKGSKGKGSGGKGSSSDRGSHSKGRGKGQKGKREPSVPPVPAAPAPAPKASPKKSGGGKGNKGKDSGGESLPRGRSSSKDTPQEAPRKRPPPM
jgi:hypothetical protein